MSVTVHELEEDPTKLTIMEQHLADTEARFFYKTFFIKGDPNFNAFC